MPKTRQVLDLLSHDELLSLVDKHNLEVADRRQRAGLIEKLESVALPELLADLPRERLKELCRDLSLDDGGKDKASIIARIAGAKSAQASLFDAPAKAPAPAPTPTEEAPKALGTSRVKAQSKGAKSSAQAAPVEVSAGAILTRQMLEGYLWSAADILRGSIDSSDYKNFIFGMLFLKRLRRRQSSLSRNATCKNTEKNYPSGNS